MNRDSAIGVFDSGIGGLTVLQRPDRFIKVGQRFLGEKVESAVRIEC